MEKYKDSLTLNNKLRRALWNVCHFLLIRPFAGPLFRRWRNLVLQLFGMRMGTMCAVSASAKIWAPWNVTLGQHVALGGKSEIYSVDKIFIGDKVTVSQGAYLCTASHDIKYINTPLVHSPIKINAFAWVAADSFVGMGVTIGEGAVVGARAAVFKDVEPWTVVGGNPAKFIKKREILDDLKLWKS